MAYLETKPDEQSLVRTKLTDEEVFSRALTKDPELFSEIVERYRHAFLRKANSILKNEGDAEDAVQDALVKIYAKGRSFKPVPGATFSSLAYRVLINTCLTLYRKRARARLVSSEELEEVLADYADEARTESRLSYDAFLAVVSRLPVQFSALLQKLVVLGRSPADVASEEGVSVGAIRTRLHRARKAFEKVRVTIE